MPQQTIESKSEADPTPEVSPGIRKRQYRRRAILLALLFHALLIALGILCRLTPEWVPQIGHSLSVSTEPAIDRELQTEKSEEIVMPPVAAPPPKPTEAAIPDLIPSARPAQITLPPPNPSLDFVEIEVTEIGVGPAIGEGFEGPDPEDNDAVSLVFSAPARGDCTIFVLDVSTSMPRELGQSGIQAVRNDLRKAIDQLPENQLFNVICFGNQADGLAPKPILSSPENKAYAHRWMTDYYSGKFLRTRTGAFGKKGIAHGIPYTPIQPQSVLFMKKTGGGSRYDLALVAAFQQQATTIYLLTDGTPSTTKSRRLLPGKTSVPRQEVIRNVTKAAQTLYPKTKPLIHCVGVNGIGQAYLKQIAQVFGGEFKNLEPVKPIQVPKASSNRIPFFLQRFAISSDSSPCQLTGIR